MSQSTIEVWSDGACKGNPGPGGWGTIVLFPGQPNLELSGYHPGTTNNRMELTAVIEGLRQIAGSSASITVHTDSQLVVKGMTDWIVGWERRGWRKADGEPVLNAELWQALLREARRLGKIRWQWVRGHSGVPLNERADQLAVEAIARRAGLALPGADAAPQAVAQSNGIAPLASPIAPPTLQKIAPTEPLAGADEIGLLRELEQRVRRAIGAHRGLVPVYDEVLVQLDAMRSSPTSTRSSRS
jgi:ribonuclease HI